MSEDEFPDPLAAFDQGLRALIDVAKMMRAYHVALTGEGFTEDQALALTIAFQYHTLQQGTSE